MAKWADGQTSWLNERTNERTNERMDGKIDTDMQTDKDGPRSTNKNKSKQTDTVFPCFPLKKSLLCLMKWSAADGQFSQVLS